MKGARKRVSAAMRRAIQESDAPVRVLAARYGISPTTVQMWRHRTSIEDRPAGPKIPRSTVLTSAEEARVVALRRKLLSLDECYYILKPLIPHLSRAALHRCLKRHGISRLAEAASWPTVPGIPERP